MRRLLIATAQEDAKGERICCSLESITGPAIRAGMQAALAELVALVHAYPMTFIAARSGEGDARCCRIPEEMGFQEH